MSLKELLRKQKQQEADIVATIEAMEETIKELRAELRQTKDEAISPTKIIADALDNAGIENYYFLNGNGCGADSHPYGVIGDFVCWGAIINGETCDVQVNLIDRVLVINDHKIEAQNLEYA